MKLAVPSVGEGGLDAQRSAHFGHADCFTILNIENGAVALDGTIANPPHEEGGCMRPVGILADAGIDAIVAVGMGMRPMQGFAAAGITVLPSSITPGRSASTSSTIFPPWPPRPVRWSTPRMPPTRPARSSPRERACRA